MTKHLLKPAQRRSTGNPRAFFVEAQWILRQYPWWCPPTRTHFPLKLIHIFNKTLRQILLDPKVCLDLEGKFCRTKLLLFSSHLMSLYFILFFSLLGKNINAVRRPGPLQWSSPFGPGLSIQTVSTYAKDVFLASSTITHKSCIWMWHESYWDV